MTNTFKLILGILITSFVFTNCASDEKKKRTIPVNSIAEITTVLSPTVEKFEVKVNEETILKGKKGTSIYIPANTFQFEDGTTPTAAVTIEIKECYSLTDMIFEDLQTTSKDQILETNGMIYLNAESNGKKLSVKEGKAVVIGFPKKNADKEMDLFYELELNDSTKTWIPDYELFQTVSEKNFAAETNTTDAEGDTFYNIEYPIEMTDDLYYYGYSPYTWTSRFDRIQFKGTNKTIIDYIETLKDIDSTNAYLFYKNNWYINLDFNIDKNGKMHNFKPRFYSDEKYNEQAIKITTELFKSLPLIDLDESNSDWRFSLGISSKRMLNKEKFKQKFREKYANYTNTAIEKIDPNALEYYMFSATEMGWINCDRFWDVDANEKTDFIVKTTNPKETKIRIIFKDIKSIMTGTYENGVLVFKNIPKEKEIKVIGISYANGKPTLSVETATTDTENFELTNFKEFSLDELETELNSLQ